MTRQSLSHRTPAMSQAITTVAISEAAKGWESGGVHYLSAAAALNAVKRQAKQRAEASGGLDITAIEWHATSSIGRSVVNVLTSVLDIVEARKSLLTAKALSPPGPDSMRRPSYG